MVKYTLKPLKGDSFEVEIDAENTVLELKKKVAEMKPDFPVEQQKLIYSGKILTDEALLKDFEIKGFIVVMTTKAAPPPSSEGARSADASAPAPAAATTPAQPPSAGGAPNTGARNLPTIITDLRSNPRFRELARTVVSNPPVLARMLPALRRTHPELQAAIQEHLEGFVQMLREEVVPATPPAGGQASPGGAPNPAMLQALLQQMPPEMRNSPEFMQFAAMVAQNPAMLQQLMRDPQIMQQAMAEAGGGGGGGAGDGDQRMSIPLTEADNQAIERLAAMGFDRNMAAQAYLACEKNEELAANFLMDGGGDEDMGD
mmetsp:Transcript_69716/g.130134  ORF Transcript_69716/g.130134 Transcript_69716/m.130134 type:complete len:316 (+) Transcript_69716:102-1049(+)